MGDLPPGDPKTMARILLSVYEGILTLARIEHDPERVRHLSRDALAAIGVREPVLPPLGGAPPPAVVLSAYFPE